MAQKVSSKELRARRRAAIEKTRGIYSYLAPGRSLVDELIAERRAEARAEEREEEELRRRYGGA